MTSSPSTRRPPTPPFPSNENLLRSQTQWLFSTEDLLRTPSVLDGLPLSMEHENRAKGVNFITQVGIMLKLPQLTLATASVFLHRFFMRYSMVDRPHRSGLHHYAVAATALFLATKVEESSRRMKELIIACCRVAQKQPNMLVDDQSKEYWKWRDTILHNEDLLLEALCFDLQLEQPYRFLYDFLVYYNVQDNKVLRNAAWAFINDSTLTILCLLFSARTIAAAALYAAAKHTGVGFPDDEQGQPWWRHLGIDLREIKRACNRMADAYESSALLRQGDKDTYVRTPEDEDETTAKTRIVSTANIHHVYSPAPSAGSGSQGTKRSRDETMENTEVSNGRVALEDRPDQSLDEPRSPKRPRRTPDRILMDHVRAPEPPVADDVQSRIDAIVSANPLAPTKSRPPISREDSFGQSRQHHSGRRRSRSPNPHELDVFPMRDMESERTSSAKQSKSEQAYGDSYGREDNGMHGRRDSYSRERAVPEKLPGMKDLSRLSHEGRLADLRMDPEDNGSEEGEL